MAILPTFNIGDLSPFIEDYFSALRANLLKEREDDTKQSTVEGSHNPQHV